MELHWGLYHGAEGQQLRSGTEATMVGEQITEIRRMMARLWLRVLSVIALGFLVGTCGVLSSDPDAGLAATTGSMTELRLAPGDKLRVTVFGEDKLSGEYQIDNAGSLSLPLAGTIQGAGLTKSELERSLTKQLQGEYLRNPKV